MAETTAPTSPLPKSWNDQELDNRMIDPSDEDGRDTGTIACHKRLSVLLRHYCHDAA